MIYDSGWVWNGGSIGVGFVDDFTCFCSFCNWVLSYSRLHGQGLVVVRMSTLYFISQISANKQVRGINKYLYSQKSQTFHPHAQNTT